MYTSTGDISVKKETKYQILFLATREEFNDFFKQSLEKRDNENKRVIIGIINEEAKQRIKNVCGAVISNINIDNNGVIHALKKKNHNLDPSDLFFAIDVINTTSDIILSDKKHLSNIVLIFKQDIDGEIAFLTEAHIRNDYLMIFNAYRQKKARRCLDATR